MPGRAPWAIAASGAVALLALGLYLRTMPPGVTWWFGASDSGDLAAAAYELRVPHPTGYPLFVLLGWLATRLPWGEPAGRLNAMDAVIGAAAAFVAGVTIWEAARDTASRRWSAVAAAATAAALGTAGLPWSQAIVTEVYALNLLLCGVVGWLTVRAGGGQPNPLPLGLALGLGLANHVTMVFALAAAAIALLGAWRPSPRDCARLAAGIALGLTPYALLPLRASADATADWGDPGSLGGLLRYVTGGDYGGNVSLRDPAATLLRALRLVRLMLGDVPLWALPAAMLGFGWAWRWSPTLARFCAALAALSLLFAVVYRVPDYAVYLLPAYLAYCLLAGAGVLAALDAFGTLAAGRRPIALVAGGGAIVALTLAWALIGLRRYDLHGDSSARVFAAATLAPLPPGAAVATARDDTTFTLRYAQRVLGMRPDVAVIDVRFPGATERLRRHRAGLAVPIVFQGEPPPRNRRGRFGSGGGTVTLDGVRLRMPPSPSADTGYLALGVGGVPARGIGVVVSASPASDGPMDVEFIATSASVGRNLSAPSFVNVGTGERSSCETRAGLLTCRADRPGMYMLSGGTP